MTIYLSNAVADAASIEQVVEYINEGTCEGMEGVEFTADMLAGQYAWSAAKDASDGEPVTTYHLEGQLEFLREAGGRFDETKAVLHGLSLSVAESD